MTLLKLKKENLIIVAGVVWLLAGMNVALIGQFVFVDDLFGHGNPPPSPVSLNNEQCSV